MFIYHQSTGKLVRCDHVSFHGEGDGFDVVNPHLITYGYAGHGKGKNNPDLETEPFVGPIPRGFYTIGKPRRSKRTGPHVIDLVPFLHDAHQRTAFQIHGDSIRNPGHASNGCIILSRWARNLISESGDKALLVVR